MKEIFDDEVFYNLIKVLDVIIYQFCQIVPILLFGHCKTPQIIST